MSNHLQQHLDAIDIALVRMLQQQGRLTNADLAERVGLSPSACLRRVQRLEQDGVLAGYRANVDPRAIGLGLEAFIGAKLVHKDQKAIDQFVNQVAQWEEVVACYILTGEMDFMLHLVTVDLDAQTFVDGDARAEPTQQLDHGGDVVQVRHVSDRHRALGEQGTGQDREGRVLRAGDAHFTLERHAAAYLQFVHAGGSFRAGSDRPRFRPILM